VTKVHHKCQETVAYTQQNKSSIKDHVNRENHFMNLDEAKFIGGRGSQNPTGKPGVMNRDDGRTSWRMTVGCSLWRHLAKNGAQFK